MWSELNGLDGVIGVPPLKILFHEVPIATQRLRTHAELRKALVKRCLRLSVFLILLRIGPNQIRGSINDNQTQIHIPVNADIYVIDKEQVSRIICAHSSDTTSRRSWMIPLACLAFLADLIVKTINLCRNLEL